MKISVVICTKNEEKNIARCLEAANSVADEIIIVDSFSTDKTAEICKANAKVKFFEAKWLGYSSTKNYANSLATHDYILSLDADEFLSPECQKEISAAKPTIQGVYTINRMTNYCGQWIKHSGWYPDRHVRLFPKKQAKWIGEIHETLKFGDDIPVHHFKSDVFHYTYYSIEEHWNRINLYSSLGAQKYVKYSYPRILFSMLVNSKFRFIRHYILKLGFLDGFSGFIIAFLSAAAVFLKYAKAYQLKREVPMSKKDIFGDNEAADESDFSSLFEKSLGTTGKNLKVGDQLKSEILSIGQEEAFVATGTPQDAVILRMDLLDENKNLKYKVGDILDVVVVKVKGGEIRVTRKGSKRAATDIDSLQDASDMELPIEGRVLELTKGGFRVDIQGQKAFCPISQIDTAFVQSGEEYVGKKLEFLITKIDEGGRNIVVSRKKLLTLQRAENEGEWLEKNKVGDILMGTVTRLEAYGAFIKFDDGVEGLVHVSEIGFSRLKHASEALKLGETVQVKILKAEEEDQRLKISLSIKQAGGVGDPWMKVPVDFPVGTIVNATVDKKENFGLFINLAPGITGLLPRSKWRDSVDAAQFENKKKGDTIQVRVDEIKFEERRLTLGLPTEAEDLSWQSHAGSGGQKSFGGLADAFNKATKK